MAVDAKLLEEYRKATEALLDALDVFHARIRIADAAERNRIGQLIEKCEAELDRIRREFERPESQKQSG